MRQRQKFQLFSRSKSLLVESGKQNFHNKVLLSKNDFSLLNKDSQRNMHRLFAHAMDWAQPIPAFQRQVHINPHSDGGEINQVFDEIKNQFHQRQERLTARPTYSRLSTTRFFCINSSHGDGDEFNPVLMTLKINFNSCERNWQQIQMYCSL